MSKWKWVTLHDTKATQCPQCLNRLRTDSGAGLVEYRSEVFHVHCLLDKLTEERPDPHAPSIWGGIYP